MNKQDIIDKLVEIGINSENAYPKSSFPSGGEICVGLYEREMKADFYFFNKYDKKIYKFPQPSNIRDFAYDEVAEKRMIPLDKCEVVWEDKPFVELPDAAFGSMTLRQYAAIHLREPISGLEWLDNMIKESNKNTVP